MNEYQKALVDARDKIHELEREYFIKCEQRDFRDSFYHGAWMALLTSEHIISSLIRNSHTSEQKVREVKE